jgi:N-acetylneuraminate synthase
VSGDPSFAIDGRRIGAGHPPFVVAELSGNHNGNLHRALALIDAAKQAGADAVKLQTYTADTMTLDGGEPCFRIEGGPWHGRRLYDLYAEASTPWVWHDALFARCREIGLPAFSTPFDATAVDFLERFDPPAYKIASFELVDLPLIGRVAATGKPLILSTGMASPAEIDEAIAAARGGGCRELVLLHCVSAYPAEPRASRLHVVPELAARAGVPVGLSDHTLGTAVAVAAVALGACFVEKHMTLRRADGGPDATFSLEPAEFTDLVRDCRVAWQAVNGSPAETCDSEQGNRRLRRSLFVVEDVAKGEPFTPASVRSIRPADGLPPKHLSLVLDCRASRDIARGTPLAWDMLAPGSKTTGRASSGSRAALSRRVKRA